MARRPSDKKPSPSSPKEKKEEAALRRRLEEALSEAELSRVLTCALLVLDETGYEQLFARLGLETAAVLALVLSPPAASPRGKVPSAPAASKGKLEQEWGRLWAQWAAVIKETGKEKGKYICQEAHWEPSYIDTTAISTDLDAIASQLRPLLSRVMAESIAPEFRFARALDEMDAGLYAGLPDWIEPGGGEPCYLGTEATSCLLEWEWALAQREGRDAAAFLDEIRDLELRLENVALDSEAIKTFVFGLSDEHLRGVLASMTRQRSLARWADAFRQAYGAWAEIVRDLSQRWNRELFVETSRANIAQDWTLALPLVQSAVKRKAFAEATALIDEALRSRLQRERAPRWEPRAELLVRLVHGGHAHLGHDHTNLVTLLRLWQESAEAQDQADLVAALALQRVALRDVERGETMLEAFRVMPPQFHAIRDALFADWRTLIVRRTLPLGQNGELVPCGGWVSALVDAAREGPAGAASFHAAVRAALEEARVASAAEPKPGWKQRWVFVDRSATPLFALALLTHDLDATERTLKKAAPKLFKLLDVHDAHDKGHLATTRRAWCTRLGGSSLIAEIMTFWREHATRFVPDPGHTMADYSQSADWLVAVRELNPAAANELLARWAEIYELKRNLWRDLAQRGVPLPAGVRAPAGKPPATKKSPR